LDKRWKTAILLLWIGGIILLLPLLFVYYTALQEVTGMAIFPFRHEVLGLSIIGILFIICGGIVNLFKD
jgi:hypothetical protein